MLRTVGWILLVPGALVFVAALVTVYMSPEPIVIAMTVGIFVLAFLTPALLFALADIVKNTRETRDAVRALAGPPSTVASDTTPEPPSRPSWGQAVEGIVDAREAGAKARARSDTARLDRDVSDT